MILSDTTEKVKRRKTNILLSTMYKSTYPVVAVDKQVFNKIRPICGNFIEAISKLIGVIINGI